MLVGCLFQLLIGVLALSVILEYFGSPKALITFLQKPKYWIELIQDFNCQDLKEIPTQRLYLMLTLGMFFSFGFLPIINDLSFHPNIINFVGTVVTGLFIIYTGLIGVIMFVRKELPAKTYRGDSVRFFGLFWMVFCLGWMIWYVKEVFFVK